MHIVQYKLKTLFMRWEAGSTDLTKMDCCLLAKCLIFLQRSGKAYLLCSFQGLQLLSSFMENICTFLADILATTLALEPLRAIQKEIPVGDAYPLTSTKDSKVH